MSEKITIQAQVAAPRNKVWEYYTSPEHITKWNFASDDWHCPSAKNDLKVGGKFNARMEAKDGSWGFDFVATYSEITPDKSYTYVMEDGRVVDVLLKDQGTGTHISVTFDSEDQNPVDMQRDGWQAILNNFKKYSEGH
ncbi:SRPBCC family protein [Fulvivirga lutimaris]|uniref:SRPBCC family protein n=1 Tax=Fulvivirga lutimaris TaxID=1819566 RepID=UPI0012BD0B75|nr:SRPBCC family protein [Fulvivirga lutimaris]MTI39632.1 activator of HSP90 ATPase [Fulvivirga lutimaris]